MASRRIRITRNLPNLLFHVVTAHASPWTEKGTDLFFYSKAGRGVRIRVSKINLSPFSLGAGFVKVPLKMGLADGLNRPNSMFGVLVNKADNNYFIPVLNAGTPYGTAGAIYLFGVGAKGYDFGGKVAE